MFQNNIFSQTTNFAYYMMLYDVMMAPGLKSGSHMQENEVAEWIAVLQTAGGGSHFRMLPYVE